MLTWVNGTRALTIEVNGRRASHTNPVFCGSTTLSRTISDSATVKMPATTAPSLVAIRPAAKLPSLVAWKPLTVIESKSTANPAVALCTDRPVTTAVPLAGS